MTFKNFTKLSLSALLLAAATHSAIAEEATGGEVTLSNGTTVSWPDFVNALNNPSSIPATLPDTDPAVKALKQAKTDSITAKNNYDDAVKALSDAKTAAENATTKVAEKRDAYNTANNLVASLNEQINSKQSEYNVAKAKLDAAEKETEMVNPSWLSDASEVATNFRKAYLADNDGTGTTATIYYQHTTGKNATLTIYFAKENPGSPWIPIDEGSFYNDIEQSSSFTVKNLQIYLGTDYSTTDPSLDITSYQGNKEYIIQLSIEALNTLIESGKYGEFANKDKRKEYQTTMNSCLNDIEKYNKQKTDYTTPNASNNPEGYTPAEGAGNMTKLDKLKYDYDTAQADQTTADRNVTTAERNVTTANTALRDAQTDLNVAYAAYNTALQNVKDNATANYKTVSLNEDVTVDTPIANFDGTFDGKNHVITLNSNVDNLFGTLSGTIANVAINGEIANIPSGARLSRVASWTGSGTYYDANGTATSNIKTIGELGFIARDRFGADVATNTLTTLTDETRVYNITVYKTSTNAPQAYVNLKNGTFTNGRDLGITANTFVKSATADFGNIANVFYTDTDGANICANVQIKDQNGLAFYCPVDITATAMTFDRTFKGNKGMNAVCLPFDLDPTDHENIDALCKYDVETADKFWFKKIEGPIPANTPFLLYSTEGSADFSLGEFHGITIKQTPAEQIVMYEGDAEDPSKSFGTLKKTGLQEFLGNYQAHKVYALKDNKFQATSGQSSFPAFRMIVTSEIVKSTGEHAPRRIAIVDEKGVEITDDIITGVENVAEETSSLNIAGGQGEIVITSDADYGKVEVYTMAGGVAAVADVMAGTTSVSLQKGIYIVMGKKVMVK